jgi:hypothetical protein
MSEEGNSNVPDASLKDYFLPAVVFFLAVNLIASSAITLKTYGDSKKAHDVNYYYSIFILILSILVVLWCLWKMYKVHGQIVAAAASNLEKLIMSAKAEGAANQAKTNVLTKKE